MYEITFSEQSLAELNKLDIPEQMKLIEKITSLNSAQLANPREPLGKFTRDGKVLYRLNAGDFRCYFEVKGNTIYNRYFLHKKTLTDFIFRTKLPISEEQLAEQSQSFWKYIESLKKK
jgi:mRNA-degrading endonuclease RelE of RelBE toxin-antitoxin system